MGLLVLIRLSKGNEGLGFVILNIEIFKWNCLDQNWASSHTKRELLSNFHIANILRDPLVGTEYGLTAKDDNEN